MCEINLQRERCLWEFGQAMFMNLFRVSSVAREPKGMIRCKSEADSIVWIEKDFVLLDFAPEECALPGIFIARLRGESVD